MNERVLRPASTVRASISADGLVLLDPCGGLVLSSNHVGARIWQLLEEQHSASEIADRLASEYDAPRDRIDQDVRAFVAALEARGLLARSARP